MGEISVVEHVLTQSSVDQFREEFLVVLAALLLQHRGDRLGGSIHAIQIAISGRAHHFVADNAHLRSRLKVAGCVVVGHDAMLFDGVEHVEKTIKVEIAVEMRSRIPFCVEIDKQEVTRSHHLVVVEYEDRLHLGSGSLGFCTQGLVILVNREIERGI